ncbi:hypothetical protein D3C72_1246930 [compost metagenome]
MAARHRAFARLSFGKRDVETLGEVTQCLAGLRVFHPATAHQQRATFSGQQRQRILQHACSRRAAIEPMHTLLEEIVRVVIGFALHVLRQAQRHRAGFRRIGQHAHRIDAGAHQLFRAHYAVPVLAHRTEGVIGADAEIVRLFNLLQHRVRLA